MQATKSAIHPTQEKLLKILLENIEDPMTIRDLQNVLELSSPSLVQHHMQQLELKGYLRRNPSNSRDYQIMIEAPERKIAHINIYGLAQCGPSGCVLDGNPIDTISISSRSLGFSASDAFAVKARGDSMIPYIKAGDIVIAKRTNTFNNGDVIVCCIEERAMIKKAIIQNQHILLCSFNDEKFPPFPASDLKIEGVVKGVISYGF